MREDDQDTSIVVCVTIVSIMGVGGYALSLGYNHTLPTAIMVAISTLGVGYYAYKKGKREAQERQAIREDK